MKSSKLSQNILDAVRDFQLHKPFLDAAPEGFAVAGTVAALSERGGGISLATAATDNAEATLTTDGKFCVVAEDKPFTMVTRVSYEEANTDDANVFVGLASSAIADLLADNGAGLPADYSGIGLYKVDGGSGNWIVELSNGTDQISMELDADGSADGLAKVAASATYQVIEISVYPKTASRADVKILIDGVLVYSKTDWVITSLAAMAPCWVIKAGAANAETLKASYLSFAQVL